MEIDKLAPPQPQLKPDLIEAAVYLFFVVFCADIKKRALQRCEAEPISFG